MIAAGISLFVVAAACTRGEEATGGNQGTQPVSQSSGATTGNLVIEFRSDPDPLTTGDNAIEVTVSQPDGSPVTDAVVSAVFSMPAMPSMNMPAMRSTATLTHEAEGRYRGTGQLQMGGTWNVAVTVSRGSEELGARKLSVIAK